MLSIGLIVLISIDLILLSYGKYKFYYVETKSMYKAFKEKLSIQKENELSELEKQETKIDEENIEKNKRSWILSTLFYILKIIVAVIVGSLAIAIFLITIGLTTSSIWGTILLAIYKNFVYAASFLIGIKLLFFLIGLGTHKALKVDRSVTQRVLIMDTMQFSMLSILLYFAAFGYPLNVFNMVTTAYEWNIVFNNLVSIMLPMFLFSLIIINILTVVFRLTNVFTKDRTKHKLIRLHQLLFIFITSCYIGILYITDIDLGFMNELNRTMYLQTLEVVKWVITSVFIPLFIYTLNNFKKTSEKVVKPKYQRRYGRYRR